MRIEYHYEKDAKGNVTAAHVIHTERSPQNQVEFPAGSKVFIDVVDFLKGIHAGTIPIAGSGWDQLSNHPNYRGKTHLQVVVSEVIRLNDAATRATLGI